MIGRGRGSSEKPNVRRKRTGITIHRERNTDDRENRRERVRQVYHEERGRGETIRASLMPPRLPPPITSKLTFVDSGLDDLYVLVDTPVAHLLLLLVNLNVHTHNSTARNNTSATRSRHPYVPVTFTLNWVRAREIYIYLLGGKSEKGSSHEGAAKCALLAP